MERNSIRRLAQELAARAPVWVLTGAGISVASGIPAYRDRAGDWMHRKPVQHNDFIGSEAVRKRYWARSVVGWPRVAQARPNPAHHALAELERQGLTSQLVTQNVDRLHSLAGSRAVVNLHGRLDRVVCLDCGQQGSRNTLQREMEALNPHLVAQDAAQLPDGDARLDEEAAESMTVPSCRVCSGTLMPDVVFYGGQVPTTRVESARNALDQAGAVLVVGSSLSVYSGFRFARRAAERGIPLYAVNPGFMRGSELFDLVVPGKAEQVLSELAALLQGNH